ncbi:MAG: molybdopterin-synthase adenylyltransferase MoeB [Pseudomonadota bacterium]
MATLSNDEILRYSRHLVMPEVSRAGQEKLKDASVLCIGAGGLGSPIALYLAAAGVGRLGLVDFDTIDISNIQRQVLYSTDDVGQAKLDVAANRLGALNPNVELVRHDVRLASDNVMDVVADYDIVVDGTDNFPTRYLSNDACVIAGKPNVYGSIFRFEGQVSVFDAAHGPCYRCLFPEPPPPGTVPSCAEGGVLGVLPGIVGSLQALETIKLILGEGDPLIGRLVLFDALSFEFRTVKIHKDPACPVCGESPSITAPIDYDAFCNPTAESEPVATAAHSVSVEAFAAERERGTDSVLLDVRSAEEIAIARIDGATCIPIGELPDRLAELNSAQAYVITCHRGPRAERAAGILRNAGFGRLRLLEGGIDAWAERVDPSLPRYG